MASFFQQLFAGEVNLSIASLPLTLLLAAIPHWYTIGLAEKNKVQGGWTNENPRAFVARLNARAASGTKLTALEEKILRGQSAQQNGFEWWALWAVATVFGYLAKVPVADMNRYTIIHVGTRIVYYYLYLNTSTRASSLLRTAAFQVSWYPAVAVIFTASKVLKY